MSIFSFRLTQPTALSPSVPMTPPSPRPLTSLGVADSATFDIYPGQPSPSHLADSPASSSSQRGSFKYDLENDYRLRWSSMAEMNNWRRSEQDTRCIELRCKDVRDNLSTDNPIWLKNYIYVCSRNGTGGRSKYKRKTDRQYKLPSKRVPCACRLIVKTYPGTEEVLGKYSQRHSHALGPHNLKFTRLREEDRIEIESLLRLGVSARKVVCPVTVIFSFAILTLLQLQMIQKKGPDLDSKHRRHFATRADVRRVERMIEMENIQLARGDGESVILWVERLRAAGHFVEIKRSTDLPPQGSNLADNAFILIIQTQYQHKCWRKYGNGFAGLDATHNTTHYVNMSLFTLMTRDEWGHGA